MYQSTWHRSIDPTHGLDCSAFVYLVPARGGGYLLTFLPPSQVRCADYKLYGEVQEGNAKTNIGNSFDAFYDAGDTTCESMGGSGDVRRVRGPGRQCHLVIG